MSYNVAVRHDLFTITMCSRLLILTSLDTFVNIFFHLVHYVMTSGHTGYTHPHLPVIISGTTNDFFDQMYTSGLVFSSSQPQRNCFSGFVVVRFLKDQFTITKI